MFFNGFFMKHILFLGQIGYFKRDYERFHIKYLKKKFKVYFLDISNLINRNFYRKEKDNFFKSPELLKVNSKKEFVKLIKKKNIEFVFDVSNPKSLSLNFFRNIINKRKIKLISMQISLFPNFKRSLILKIKYLLRIAFLNQSLLFHYFRNFIKRKKEKLQTSQKFYYDYIFCAGKKGENNSEIDGKTKFIFSHTSDYEKYLYSKKFNHRKNNFFLFLDQFLPYHNAYIHRDIPAFVSPKKYYNSINNFFEKLEKIFKTNIIISAHPRSDYKSIGNKFNGRKIVDFDKTNYFVSKSSGVINYTSTAMNYAVIHKKPIIFYTTNEINHSHDAFHVDYLSKKLGSNVLNIDKMNIKDKSLKGLLKVNELKYKKYLKDYIRHPNSGKSTSLKKILNLINEK